MSTPTLSLVWLKERSTLGILPDPILEAMLAKLQFQNIAAMRRLVLEDTIPDALYILGRGRLEQYRTNPYGPAWASSLLPGAVLHTTELLLEQTAANTIVTLTDCEFWVLPSAEFKAIAHQFPDLIQIISRQLVDNLVHANAQLAFEQERQAILRPYQVPKARRGIVGTSRYAVRLRQQIKEASRDHKPVIILGEPGLEKDNIAALIHFGSHKRREPLATVNCSTLQTSGVDLFGRVGGKPGLLEALGEGTLILNNLQDLASDLLPKLKNVLETGTYTPIQRDFNGPIPPKPSNARIIIVTEKTFPDIERLTYVLKVPPLRVRKSDVKTQIDYYLSLISKSRSLAKRSITPEALRRLQAYNYPGNLAEL